MLYIDKYETPEDGCMVSLAEYRDLRTKVDTLCELAEMDKELHPETVLRIFGRTEALERLQAKQRRDREWWLGKQKEGMYVD